MLVFFANFHLTLKKYFFKENGYDTHFLIFRLFIFLFKIKYYPITRKEQNEKLFFLYFFQEFKTHFFGFDKSQIFES